MKDISSALFFFIFLYYSNCLLKTSSFALDNTVGIEITNIIEDVREYNQNFKQLVQQNETLDYDSCKELIQTLECNKIDEWQSEIEKLKLQNLNIEQKKVPFYENKKEKKMERMKSLLELSDGFNDELLQIVNQLMEQQSELEQFSDKIKRMFKLPESTEFVQKQINVVKELNNNVPSVAEEELSKSNEVYNIGDQSISAQTASNEIVASAANLQDSLKSVKSAFNSRQQEVNEEKQLLKESIIRLRALIQNEITEQNQNNQRIQKLEDKIQACKNKPMNLEKDCEPIKVRSQKLLTELQILTERTNEIYTGLNDIFPSQEKSKEAKSEEEALDEEFRMLIGEAQDGPNERQPIHHLKDHIEKIENQ